MWHVVSFDPTSVPAKWHLIPSNCLCRMHKCDRRQTDRPRYGKKYVAIGRIVGAARAIPPNNRRTHTRRAQTSLWTRVVGCCRRGRQSELGSKTWWPIDLERSAASTAHFQLRIRRPYHHADRRFVSRSRGQTRGRVTWSLAQAVSARDIRRHFVEVFDVSDLHLLPSWTENRHTTPAEENTPTNCGPSTLFLFCFVYKLEARTTQTDGRDR